MHRTTRTTLLAAAIAALVPSLAFAQDLYSRDTPADMGIQPNPDMGPMWLSEDIWVRTTPDPNYRPFPFTAASPPWTPAPHQNPEYRDPRLGLPNYVYVRVRNIGPGPSTGTEQLRLYWAKASTGLAWPASWVDALATVCGNERLLGAEITKPRVNAATASPADRTLLRDAYLEVASTSGFDLLAGYDYWTKQQHVHRLSPEHDNPAFLPWHREFLNRLEALLQEAKPLTKMMYWDWTTDPAATGTANLYTPGFMGDSGRGITAGTSMGSILSPALEPAAGEPSGSVLRHLGSGARPAQPDGTILGRPNYFGADPANNFSLRLEETPNHKSTHTWVGGSMGTALIAAKDPFFFLLHGKVDELWARWQRANPARVEAASAYGTAATNPEITGALRPWNGSGAIDPWTTAGGQIVTKTSFHRSVLSPPIYDTAPLVIPALAVGQAVILEIPWYPPNPAHYGCLGDMRHFCLLSRVTPGIAGEGMDVNVNVRNNNNLAWKNIEVDDFSGMTSAMSMLVANDTDAPMQAELVLREPAEGQGRLRALVASVQVGVPKEIRQRMRGHDDPRQQAGIAQTKLDALERKQGMPGLPRDTVLLRLKEAETTLPVIDLAPGERFPLHVVFELKRDYKPSKDPLLFDVVQRRPDQQGAVVGGVRLQLDVSRLALVKAQGLWRHAPEGVVDADWTSPGLDDAKWPEAPAPLGFAPALEAMTGVEAGTRTAYFRKRFDVQDPGALRDLTLRLRHDDGAVVYLNGREVHRVNMPDGAIDAKTAATTPVTGAAELAYFPVKLSSRWLRRGGNVLAVEVHQAADDKQADLIFDAELLANRADASEAPSARIALDDALVRAGRTMPLRVDAVDPDGRVRKLRVLVDDQEIGSVDGGSGDVQWTPGIGPQRVRVMAEDDTGATAVDERLVVGVENLPPIVRMEARPGQAPGTLVLSAEASDDDGQIREVEFFLADSEQFDAKLVSVGVRNAAPFEVTVQVPPSEHRMATARATDDRGEIGVASTHLEAGLHH